METQSGKKRSSLVDKGKLAARSGKSVQSNPVRKVGKQWEAWRRGWFQEVNTIQEQKTCLEW